MELMEAIKTCIDAKVSIQTYQCMPAEVWLEHEDFLEAFMDYDSGAINSYNDGDVLHLLSTEKDGVIFKTCAWTSELKVRE